MLRSLFRRRAPTAPPDASVSHPFDGAIQALYRADGTQSTIQFQQNTLPLFQALHRAAQRRDSRRADQALWDLLRSITQACQRASNHRLPRGQQATDYRRYETRYNYALISAMAIAWHMDAEGLKPDDPPLVAETFLPPQGLVRLRQEPLVWAHWRAFFEGREDGGLRDIAGRRLPPASRPGTPADVPRSLRDNGEMRGKPSKQCNDGTSGSFLSPSADQRAKPLAKGWVLVAAIREGLRDGSLPYNRKHAWVQVDREGRTFLQVPEVFEWCHARLASDVPPKTLINQFGRLNICTRSRKGQNLLRGGRRHQKTDQQGFVIEDPGLFWDGEAPTDQFYIRHLTQPGIGQTSSKPPA